MRARNHRTSLAAALAAMVASLVIVASAGAGPVGMVCTNGSLSGSTRTFNLTARSGSMETPDGNTNLMWSYSPAGGDFQTPGPVLCANENETVVVNLRNRLPEATSIVFPGQEGVTATGDGSQGLLAREVPADDGASVVTYRFTADHPGTFVYESGSEPAKQVEMGLASALVIRPDGHPDRAYGDASTQFNPAREYLILLNDIDPDLHDAVKNGTPYDVLTMHSRYYTINGRSFPDTVQDNDVPWLPTQPYGSLVDIKPYDAVKNPQPVLIRMLNVGLENHPFHPHGQSLRMVGKDGRLVRVAAGDEPATEHFAETLPSGATEDYLFKFNDQDGFDYDNKVPVTFPSYLNLNFKDANTWYSGSPYLGTVGTMPAGTVSQNICGSFYFPWHSHALNEFANWDVPFGGMATMLRVEPLEGCATVKPGYETQADAPDRATVATGSSVNNGSSVAGLAATGGGRYLAQSTGSGSNRTVAWQATFFDIPSDSTNLVVSYTGRNRRTNNSSNTTTNFMECTQLLRVWKWTTSQWVTLDTQRVGQSDVEITEAAPNPNPRAVPAASPYVGTGPNAGDVRVRVECSAATPSGITFRSSGDFMQITYDAAP